jgi:hypothetical protein
MAKSWQNKKNALRHIVKGTSQGDGGRGRKTKQNTSTMNKHRRRSFKKYRGQGK